MKSSLEAENKFVFVGIYFYFGTGDYQNYNFLVEHKFENTDKD
jgi:hypothetical protein